jgi:hypothetical protein
MVTDCQLVLLPLAGDRIINARLSGGNLKVGVEVEKGEEDELFTREELCMTVTGQMGVAWPPPWPKGVATHP